jgi:hypothetical protein
VRGGIHRHFKENPDDDDDEDNNCYYCYYADDSENISHDDQNYEGRV